MNNDYQDQFQQQGSNQQPQQGNPNQPQQQQQGVIGNSQMDAAKHAAEQQIDQAIDQFAQKIPGGAGYTQQAKDAAAGILDSLEQQAEQHMGDVGGMIGNLFGHHNKDNQK